MPLLSLSIKTDQHNSAYYLRIIYHYILGISKSPINLNDREANIDEINEIMRIKLQISTTIYNFTKSISILSKEEIEEKEDENTQIYYNILKFQEDYIKACNQNEQHKFFHSIEFPSIGDGVSDNPMCGFCLQRKPKRTHHCRVCKACIRKMDHHCSVLCVCIGSGNYKYFCLTLFYSNILNIFMLSNSMQSLKFYFNEYQVSLYIFIILYYRIHCMSLSLLFIY